MFLPVAPSRIDERFAVERLVGLARLDKGNMPVVGVVTMFLLLFLLQPVSQLSED